MISKLLKSGLAALALSFVAALPASADSWTLLGQQHVGRNPDLDTFHVGREAGHFDALRFRVLGNRVAVGDVKVHYSNGATEHLNVREHLVPGVDTPTYDLKGTHRRIERIDVLYQTEGRWPRLATMQVFGLKYEGGSIPGNPQPSPLPWPGQWETLGSQSVGLTVDHDTVYVGGNYGKFRKIKLQVQDNAIHLYNVRVTFRDGTEHEYSINGSIPAGGSTHELDLAGYRRTIQKIDLVYHSKAQFTGLARVTVLGLH